MIGWDDRWMARLVDGLEPHPPPLSSQRNKMFIFGLRSMSNDQLGWSIDSNPIGHPSPAKKMKCSFFHYIQHLMIGQAGQWTQIPSATPLQPKKWNAHFWITFKFWWSAGLVDGLEHHLPPLSSQKNEMLIFGLHLTSDDWLGWLMDSNAICHLSPANKMKYSSLDYIQLLMISQACRWTQTPSSTLLQPKKWNASFGWRSTSDDWLGWPMDSNPIHHLSPAIKLKCSFLDYVQIFMISRAGWWTWTPSATPLQPTKWNAHFLDYVQLLMIGWAGQWTWTPYANSLQPKQWNAHFSITFNFWWLARLVNGLKSHLPPLSRQKNEMLIFGLHSNSDDWLG